MEMKRAKYRYNKVAKTMGLLGHLLLTRQILMIINILKKMFNLPSLEISDGQLAPTQATQNHQESQKKVTTLLIHFSSGKTHLIYIPSFHKSVMPGYIGNPIMIIFCLYSYTCRSIFVSKKSLEDHKNAVGHFD